MSASPEPPALEDDPLLASLPRIDEHPVVGSCVLRRHIAEGGFGTVFEAWHIGARAPMAVKLLRTSGLEEQQRTESILRFQREGRTLLGLAQWEWLTRRVAASEASFKLICTGMIWNGATRPGKTDHWGTYSEERDALFAYLDEQEVSGVVLVGGDIHRSRVVEHERQRLDAYPLTELITSPLGNSVIVAANAPHPGLRWDAGLPETFLLVSVDAGAGSGRATLTATFKDATGKVHHELRLEEAELAHR